VPGPISSEEQARVFDALDQVASLVLTSAAPIEVDIVRSVEDLIATYGMRHDFLVAIGFADPDQIAQRQEKDAYDDHAVHIAAKYAGSVVGTIRLIFPREGKLLPMEADFGVRIEPVGGVVELGRLVVAREFRGDRHRVSSALLARAWIEMRSSDYSMCGGAVSREIIDLYERMGIAIEILGAPRMHWGKERFLCRWALSVPEPQSWR
jgi:predicted GNAT family N-acyltransferase